MVVSRLIRMQYAISFDILGDDGDFLTFLHLIVQDFSHDDILDGVFDESPQRSRAEHRFVTFLDHLGDDTWVETDADVFFLFDPFGQLAELKSRYLLQFSVIQWLEKYDAVKTVEEFQTEHSITDECIDEFFLELFARETLFDTLFDEDRTSIGGCRDDHIAEIDPFAKSVREKSVF